MSSQQFERHFGVMGWSGGSFGSGFYSDGHSAGYKVNNPAGYAVGATAIALDTGSGFLLPGSRVKFGGDANYYTVASSVGGQTVTQITLETGLLQTLADNTAMGDKVAVGPSDQMAYLLAGRLAADALLAAVFPDGVDRMGVLPDIDYRQMPRCYVYPAGVTQEDVAQIADKQCDVVVELVFAVTAMRPAGAGGATLASVLTHVERVAATHHQMAVSLVGVSHDVTLADRMVVQSYQTLTALDEKERPMAWSQSVQFRYWVTCERGTERIWNVAHPS